MGVNIDVLYSLDCEFPIFSLSGINLSVLYFRKVYFHCYLWIY